MKIASLVLHAGYQSDPTTKSAAVPVYQTTGNDSDLLIVFYVQIMPDDLVMPLHRF